MATKMIYTIWCTKFLSEFLLAVTDTDIKGHKTLDINHTRPVLLTLSLHPTSLYFNTDTQ